MNRGRGRELKNHSNFLHQKNSIRHFSTLPRLSAVDSQGAEQGGLVGMCPPIFLKL